MKSGFLALALVIATGPATAWDGFDWNTGTFIEIEKGDLVREGEEIKYYDEGKGEYRTAKVQSIGNYGNMVEVKIVDNESGELRTFAMEK